MRLPPQTASPAVSSLPLAHVPSLVLLLLAALGYSVAAQYIIWLNDPERIGAGFWPAAGVSVAILLATPTKRWTWPLLGIAGAEAVGDLVQGYPPAGIPWWTAGNVLEPALGAFLVRRYASARGELLPLGNLLRFIALAVVVGPLVGATIGTFGTVSNTELGWVEAWLRYVAGDGLGVLVTAPLLLTFGQRAFQRRRGESVFIAAGLAVTSLVGLTDVSRAVTLLSPYLVVPFLTWAALRFGIRECAWFVFMLAQVANVSTAFGRGPFADLANSPAEAVAMVQLFLLIASSSAFILAAVVSDLRDREEVQRLLRDLADSMPQLVWVANERGIVEYYNRRGAAYFGEVPADESAEDQHVVRSPEELAAFLLEGDGTLGTRAQEREHRILMQDGTSRWHLSRAERVATIDGVKWYGTSTDIDERKRAEQSKDEFIAIASHELRNPVGAVHGIAQLLSRMLQRGTLTTERLTEHAASLLGSSTYLARLTDDLMDASRLQRGILQLRLDELDIAELITSVISSPQWDTERLRLALDDDLGDVALDPARFRQLLSNLVDNALKYSPAESVVEICARRERGGVLVQVVDSGVGIPEVSLQRIFEPFGRAVNTGSVPGLGMGLYIAREIARRHGGSLFATSEGEGRGTTMSLWLPHAPAEAPHPTPVTSA